jgi:hypothetical protein
MMARLAGSVGKMREDSRRTEIGWAPRQDSYEEAVLNWYEQVESSFRRRRLGSQQTQAEGADRREAFVNTAQTVFD